MRAAAGRHIRGAHTTWVTGLGFLGTGVAALIAGDPGALLLLPGFAGVGAVMDWRASRRPVVGPRGVLMLRRANNALKRVETVRDHPLALGSVYATSASEVRGGVDSLLGAMVELRAEELSRAFDPAAVKARWKALESQVKELEKVARSLAGLLEESRELNASTNFVTTEEVRSGVSGANLRELRERIEEESSRTRAVRHELRREAGSEHAEDAVRTDQAKATRHAGGVKA